MSVVHLVTLLCISLYHAGFVSAWDADAGITTSWTKVDNVTVTSTSGTNSAFVNDGNDNTNWVSASCLPTYYFNRDDVNVLKNSCANMKCFLNSVSCSNCQDSSDGSVYTTLNISPIIINGDTKANFCIKLTPPIKLEVITFSGRFSDNTTSIFVKYDSSVDKPGDMLKSFLTTDSYKTFQLTPSDSTALISEIEITSSSSFGVKEIAAIGEHGCTEKITVDLGTFREVGIIRTRHWAGTNAAMSLALLTSSDGISWNNVSMLDPEALRPVMTTIPPRLVRFISLTYRVNLKNYQKVYCYEIDAWDRNGIWGPNIPVRAQPYSLRDLLGVNGIWGWGHNSYSDSSIQGKGPTLYNAIASHARNYHNLNWDVTDPDNDPEFPAMAAGNGTQAKWWLNWDTEYTAWANSNLKVDASIQFLSKTFPPEVWNNPEAAAFHYGQEFAKHFGTAVGNGLIEAIEIGNEPWDYEASFYAMILKGMSDGVRSVDSSIHVLPGAFQAESKFESHNYIGTRVLPNVADNLSAINCHTYSFLVDPMGIRRGVHPENRLSTFNSIRPISHWRDVNMPGKPVWVTEWGWDSDGQGETCTFPECVTEQAQAVYGVRGLAILSRSGIARATWYFYASLDHDSLYGRSGLTSSLAKNFTKKTVFKVFEELLNQMGNTHFLDVVQEDNDGYIYLYSDQHNQKTSQGSFGSLNLASHILAWLPLDIADTRTHLAEINLPGNTRVVQGWRFVAHSSVNHTEHISLGQLVVNGHTLLLPLSTYPVLVELAQTHTVIPVGKR